MDFKNIYDMHTHSDNSFDGNDSCVLLCEDAVEKGAAGIAITDHLDIDDNKLDVRRFVTNQFVSTTSVKYAFRNSLDVLQGVELGQGIYRKEMSEKILTEVKYDFVLGSIHNLENMQDFYFLEYKEEEVPDLLRRYFEAELELARWDKTDSLAHLTYPFRYICGNYGIQVDITKYSEIIDEILETLAKNNKALELNVSSIDCYHHDTMPNVSVIKRFKELGGKYVTVGSDSHYAKKVCNNINKGYELLLEAGFNEFTIFKQREPVLIPIEKI